MFRASIRPSSGVQVVCCCIWCSALGVVAVVLRSRCVFLCTVCKFVFGYKLTHSAQDYTPRPLVIYMFTHTSNNILFPKHKGF